MVTGAADEAIDRSAGAALVSRAAFTAAPEMAAGLSCAANGGSALGMPPGDGVAGCGAAEEGGTIDMARGAVNNAGLGAR